MQTRPVVKKVLYGITVILFMACCYVVFDLVSFNKNRQATAVTLGAKTTNDLRGDVNDLLTEVMQQGEALAQQLENASPSNEELIALIKERSLALDQILGVTVAYQPYGFDENTALYAPYFDKKQKEIIPLQNIYNYTDGQLETSSWYTNVLKNGKGWVEPYYGQGAQAFISDYGIPFYYTSGPKKGQIRGVVSMTISLDGFTELIHALSLGKTGYGFVASSKGTILAHPVGSYVGKKTIQELSAETEIPALQKAYVGLMQGKTGNVDYIDAIKQQETIFFYDHVLAADWRIGVLFFKNDLLGGENEVRQKYIIIALVVSLLLFFLMAAFFNRDYLSEKEIWQLGFFAGFVLLANIVLIGYLQHTAVHTEKDLSESPPIADVTTLNSIINEQALLAEKSQQSPRTIIPTGVYVDRLYFEDSYNVSISGKVWQKYPTAIIDSVTTGFAFPQTAPFAEAQLIEEIGRQLYDDYTLITYSFRNTFRLNFEYGDYPFDRRNIHLYFQPLSFKDRLMFVPDLESYTYTNPSQKSGVSKKIKLSGSNILETYFNYNYYAYDANFGAPVKGKSAEVPELYFNIKLKRVLITAFVTYLIPIFVVLIMMYMLLYTIKKNKKKEVDGNIVSAMTAFFFVLIFSHIDLRKNIDTAELIYMEYFYFVTYVMILISTYNLIAYSRGPHKIFSYKNNLIVKATFWPIFLVMILIITLLMFY
ncbi:hypothetical protein EAX61_02940 [Dokdonia sinensis]|uniref:Cache domain-containing protein n=1 Tax=Dokdonia sinensis TaxID=2479847 RepID=A0A3M0GF24_9FLAO|nr:cache domain-containing protein [Dokdonia sinensis]RMB63364.1 hypothetical protein EAX61_02940 [Dokdonia sinensis]